MPEKFDDVAVSLSVRPYSYSRIAFHGWLREKPRESFGMIGVPENLYRQNLTLTADEDFFLNCHRPFTGKSSSVSSSGSMSEP